MLKLGGSVFEGLFIFVLFDFWIPLTSLSHIFPFFASTVPRKERRRTPRKLVGIQTTACDLNSKNVVGLCLRSPLGGFYFAGFGSA